MRNAPLLSSYGKSSHTSLQPVIDEVMVALRTEDGGLPRTHTVRSHKETVSSHD